MDAGLINTGIGIAAGVVTIVTGAMTINNAIKVKKGESTVPKSPLSVKSDKPKRVNPLLNPVSAVTGVEEFTNSDDAYRAWLAIHPHGFVINTPRNTPMNNMILHRASCSHVKNFDARTKGAFTERDYIKICASELKPLKEWTKSHGRVDESFSGECSVCKPA